MERGEEKRKGRGRKHYTTISLRHELRDAINLLAGEWQVPAETVIERLLDFFLEAQQVRGVNPQRTPAPSPDVAQPAPEESRHHSPNNQAGEVYDVIREIQAVMLFLFEPIVGSLEGLIGAYPDLRAEIGPHLTALKERLSNAIQAWFPPPKPLPGAEEEERSQEERGEDDQGEEAHPNQNRFSS